MQCFGCDSCTGKINTLFFQELGHAGKDFLSVLVKTEVVYSFTLLFELKLVPNFCIVYFNATLTNVPLTLDYVMPFFNQVELLTLFKQYNLLFCLFLINQHVFPLSFSLPPLFYTCKAFR